MRFSVISPSFRSSAWLKLCIASVADQGVNLEHIVQDSCSDDGTQDWLPKDPRVKAFIEKDRGMYDAVNRGLRRASGDILSYVNCDEQYLPGALQAVGKFFETHPQVDIVFSDTVVVDALGQYMCHRKVQVPMKLHAMVSHLPTFTCSMFFRRRVLEEHGLYFDSNYRDVGDCRWVLAAINQRVPMGVLRYFTSAFTETGENMNLKPNARREVRELYESAPLWARKCRRVLEVHHRLRRLFGGIYFQRPFNYALYTLAKPDARTTIEVPRPTFRWKRPKAGSAPTRSDLPGDSPQAIAR